MIKIKVPLTKEARANLKCGQEVLLSGTVYTARDAAHKKIAEIIKKKTKLPVNFYKAVLYYAGPTSKRPDGLFGSCGPTTSRRMDDFTELLLKKGLGAMVGKGRRDDRTRRLIKKHKAVYFLAPGGAGAYLAKKIHSQKTIAFKELGPGAIYELELKDFPAVVGIDSKGKDIFKTGKGKK